MAGVYEAEYKWALAHPTNPHAENLIRLASMYRAQREHVTLALIEETAKDIRVEMKKTP